MRLIRELYEISQSGRSSRLIALGIFLVAATGNAAAQSVTTYSFTTTERVGPAAAFVGESVSGTFDYNRDGFFIGPSGFPNPGAANYAGSITNLIGAVGGRPFSDPLGIMVVGNDTFLPPVGSDILVLGADPALFTMPPPQFVNFNGFDINGHALINARFFWIEGQVGIGDFLGNQNSPATLPNFPGRLALDLLPFGVGFPATEVIFEDLIVRQVVMIDVKPGSDPGSINPGSKGKTPVAILTTDTFDAIQVDPLSVQFGPQGAVESHGRAHVEDIDDDGDIDLVLHFTSQDTGVQCGDSEITLTGETFDGQLISGSDAISTVPCPVPEAVTYNFTQAFGNIAVSGTLMFGASVPDSISVDDLNTLATWNLSFHTIVPDPVFPLEPFSLSDSDSSWATELIPGTSVQIDATETELVFDLMTPFGTNAALVLRSDGPDFRQFFFSQVNQPGFVGNQIAIQGIDIAAESFPLPFDAPLAFPAVSTAPAP